MARPAGLAALVLILIVANFARASADSSNEDGDGGDHQGSSSRQEAEFSVGVEGCESETVSPSSARRWGSEQVQTTGSTTSDIALMEGDYSSSASIWTTRRGESWISGTWELDPDASTGTISGYFWGRAGADDAGVLVVGSGDGALEGVDVGFVAQADDDAEAGSCDDGFVLSGHGLASRPRPDVPDGMVVVESTKSFETTLGDLTGALDANPNIGIVATVNHQAGAASRDLVLPPTTEVFFGNPALGTPLMQASQSTGIDLPQKMLVWTDLLGDVQVGYNAPSYLAGRHDLDSDTPQLSVVAGALANFAGVATGTVVEPVFSAGGPSAGDGLVVVPSNHSVDDTAAALVAALDAAPPINVVLTLDHDANAANAGLALNPTRLIVFGNPSLGTPLMQTNRAVALDLPQKMLVIEDDAGNVSVLYNDPAYVADRHDVRGQDDIVNTITGALANFSAGATS